MIPAPLTANVNVGPAVILNALAPGLKTMPFTSVMAERETSVKLEKANVAVSDGAFGTVVGIQFVAVFQSPEPGFVCQVALPAKVVLFAESRSSDMPAARSKRRARRRKGEQDVTRFEKGKCVIFLVFFLGFFAMKGGVPLFYEYRVMASS